MAVERARDGRGPTLIECLTWRHHGHFIGDSAWYKKPEDEDFWREKDPIPNFERRLIDDGVASASEIESVHAKAQEEVTASIGYAEDSPYPEISVMYEDLDF
jgi:pyruvate dehydrogenase E1 component alpha subunit